MQIGQLAERAGVTPDTVRFYERRGVLPLPERRASGYRVYTDDTVERIRLAKSLQANGFTLDEIIDALASMDAGTTCADERWRVQRVLERIERQLAELEAARDHVRDTLSACHHGDCVIDL